MALAVLSIDIIAKLAALEADLGKAVRLNEKAAKDIADKWDAAGSAVKTALGVALAGLSAGAFIGMTRNLLDGVDALNDVADATGATIENISALEDLALRTGTSLSTVEAALIKFNGVLKDATPGSETERTLKGIGLSAEELRKMDPAEALKKVAKALSGYADDGNKARLMQDWLGKSLKDIAPFMKDLGEAGKLNAGVTKQQADEAENLNKKLFALEASSQAAKRAILVDLLPAFNSLFSELADGMKYYKSFWDYVIDVGTTNPFASINETLTTTATNIHKVGEQMDAIKARQQEGGLFARLNKGADDAELRRLEKELGLLKQRQAFFQARQVSESGPVGGGRGLGSSERPSVVVPDKPDKNGKPAGGVREVVSDYDKYLEKLEATRGRLLELSAVEQAVYDMAAGKLGDLTHAQKDRVLAVAESIDQDKASEEAQKAIAKATDEAARSQERMRSEALRLWEGVQTPAENYAAEITNIIRLMESGAFGDVADPDVADRITRIQEAAKKRLADSTKSAGDELSEFAKQAQRNIQDALGDTVLSALKGDFDSIEKMWGDLVLKMIAQAAAAQLNDALFGKGGSGGGWVSQAFSAASLFFGGGSAAGATSGLGSTGGVGLDFSLAGGRAGGGPVAAGSAYLVGEQGPEVAVFGKGGNILPANVTRQVMGHSAQPQITLNITSQVGEIVTPTQLANASEAIRLGAMAGIADAMRRGKL